MQYQVAKDAYNNIFANSQVIVIRKKKFRKYLHGNEQLDRFNNFKLIKEEFSVNIFKSIN